MSTRPKKNMNRYKAGRKARRLECEKRERIRRLRAQIHAAMKMSARRPLTWGTWPYRALDRKDASSWLIADSDNVIVAYASSRDKARAQAKKMTADESHNWDRDASMLSLGWRRISHKGHVEQRFKRVVS